ncbi:hypothetical protein STEG23_034764 [Scotinomys teguina]
MARKVGQGKEEEESRARQRGRRGQPAMKRRCRVTDPLLLCLSSKKSRSPRDINQTRHNKIQLVAAVVTCTQCTQDPTIQNFSLGEKVTLESHLYPHTEALLAVDIGWGMENHTSLGVIAFEIEDVIA